MRRPIPGSMTILFAAVLLLSSAWAVAADRRPIERDPGERTSHARERAHAARSVPRAVTPDAEQTGPVEPRNPDAEPAAGSVAAAVASAMAPVKGDARSGAELRRYSHPLRTLLSASAAGVPATAIAHPQARDAVDRGLVAVELLASPTARSDIQRELTAAGARNVTTRGARTTASVPYEALGVVTTLPAVRRAGLAGTGPRDWVREGTAGIRPMVGNVVTEGSPLTGAPTWHAFDAEARGLSRDTGVKVAVLDLGFLDYEELYTTELPPDAHVFTLETATAWDIEGCLFSDPTNCIATGTALAEIVTDMNPRVELHLISVDPDDPVSFELAVDYLLAQGIDVAVGGTIWSPGFYGDGWGTGPYSTQVERAVNGGVMWVNDIGDLDYLDYLFFGTFEPYPARGHWMGDWTDEVDHFTSGQFDNDTYLDAWSESDDPATDEDSWLNRICLGPGEFINLELIWDDWIDGDGNGVPAAEQDFRFDVFQFNESGTIIPYDTSSGLNPDDVNFQGGEEGDYPWDSFGIFNEDTEAQCYYLAIFGEFIYADSDNRFHMFWTADSTTTPGTLSAAFEAPYSVPEGTRMIPTDSPGVVGVGSSSLADVVEPFNPRGILDEQTPRLCAPARVSTSSLGVNFLSSFSAAHVGGAISLVMDKVSFLDADDVQEVFASRALDITGEAVDTRCGSGRLCTLTTGCAIP